VHRNGNLAGNGNTGGGVSPRNTSDTSSRKRLSDQALDTNGKKRRVNEQAEEQVGSVHT